MQLIPSIDLRGGHSVRLYKGDFGQETRYELTPQQLLQRYADFGAQWLHIVDLDGARDGQLANRDLIVSLAAQRRLRVQVGGGIRSRAVATDLLGAGVDRVVLGSVAAEQPQLASELLSEFGGERVCLAFDIKHDAQQLPLVYTRGWTQGTSLSLWQAVERFRPLGLRHVLCTDIDRDGAMAGPSLALYAAAHARYADIHWQASGGVRHAEDLAALAAIGCAAAISGKALLEERIAIADLTPYLGAHAAAGS